MSGMSITDKAALTLVLLLVLAYLGVVRFRELHLSYSISTISAECMGSDLVQPDIRAYNATLVIVEPFQTPNPCFKVVGEVKIRKNVIEVNLGVESTSEVCVQCTGEVVAEVIVSNLSKGQYSLLLRTHQRAENYTINIGL